jgi:Nif-specific regulatory protein
MLAYLVIREGTKWSDVYRLVPGRTVTIGRAGTNQIVIKDERASRQHAEIFITRGAWTLRDLDSRNGTFVGERQVRGDYTLQAGDVIRIGGCYLAFVQDLTQAFPDPVTGSPGIAQLPLGDETVSGTLTADTGEIEDASGVLDDTRETRRGFWCLADRMKSRCRDWDRRRRSCVGWRLNLPASRTSRRWRITR